MKYLLSVVLVFVVIPSDDEHERARKILEACSDTDGIKWVLPFKDVQKKAKAENKLVMMKAIAFGTDKQGGW